MGKHITGKTFRSHHKSNANNTRNKRERLFDSVKEDILGTKGEKEYANDNSAVPYREGN